MLILYEVLTQNVAVIFYHVYFVVNWTSGIIARYIVNRLLSAKKFHYTLVSITECFFVLNCVSLQGIYGLTPAALLKSWGFAEVRPPRIAPLATKNSLQESLSYWSLMAYVGPPEYKNFFQGSEYYEVFREWLWRILVMRCCTRHKTINAWVSSPRITRPLLICCYLVN